MMACLVVEVLKNVLVVADRNRAHFCRLSVCDSRQECFHRSAKLEDEGRVLIYENRSALSVGQTQGNAHIHLQARTTSMQHRASEEILRPQYNTEKLFKSKKVDEC